MTLAARWPLVLSLAALLTGCAPATLDTTRLEAAIERFERAAAQAEAAAAQAEASARQAERAAQNAAADTGDTAAAITPSQAIERAEAFVRANGYTDAPADRAAISAESIEWSSDLDEILAERRGTLKPQAYGYRRYAGGYAVLFLYATGDDQVGRAVTMDLAGEGLRVMHQDALLQGSSVVRTAPAPP